jgi:rhodanese-like protein
MNMRERARWLVAAALAALAFSGAGAAPAGDPEVPEKYISVDEARKLLAPPQRTVFIDVRDAEQFAELHIQGARNVPLGELPKRLAEIPRQPALVLY